MIKIDRAILEKFENSIDTMHPEKSVVPIKILGFGEISLVFEIENDPSGELAYKRLPLFESEQQVNRHIHAYEEYNRMLNEQVGLHVPDFATAWFWMDKSKHKICLYCVQEKLNPKSMGHSIIHHASEDDIAIMVLLIMRALKKIWRFTRDHPELIIGIDGQISNWAVDEYGNADFKFSESTKLSYVDTSTPMYRTNGEEAMEPLLFLKSAPSFLRWVLKLFFLKEVVDRYYDWRLVTIDLIANFYKEQKVEFIPRILQVINNFFSQEAADFGIKAITQEEVSKYYEGDKKIWVIFQSFRRFDRWLQTKLFRRPYDFYLPPKIKR